MRNLSDIISVLEARFPLHYAEEFDNPGLLVGNRNKNIAKALICLDCTASVVDEAIAKNADLIISHHPVIFKEQKSFCSDTPLGKTLVKAAENGISIYSAHTNLDSAPGGLTDYIAKLLCLEVIETMEGSLGRVLKAPEGFTAKMLIERIKGALNIPKLYSTLYKDKPVSVIAICNGGGGDLVDAAARCGAQIYISGDLKHHDILSVKDYENLDFIEIRHHECEVVMTDLVLDILEKEIPEVSFEIAQECKSPLIDTDLII